MFKKMKFQTKLFVSITVLVLVSILMTSGNAIRISKNSLDSFGKNGISESNSILYNSLIAIDENIRVKLDGDLIALETAIKTRGGLIIDSNKKVKENLINQVTHESTIMEIPQLQAGVSFINGSFDLVDNIKSITGSSATIFQKVDDKLLRISTTVKDNNEKRAIGTYIPSDSPVYQSIMRGETFRGKAYVVNDWYLTAYKPLMDIDGKIIGAIYVGQPMLSDQVKKLVLESKFGAGYFFIYGEDGTFLIHQDQNWVNGKVKIHDIIPEFKDVPDGYVYYKFKDEEKISYKVHIEKWGVYLGATIDRKQLVAGSDTRILINCLIIGLVVIVFSIIVTILLVRTINKPLKELSEKAIMVGQGDYTIEFSSEVGDAIGNLTNALGIMTKESREMILNLSDSSKQLGNASEKLKAISGKMVESAEQTTKIATQTAVSADEVSDNMNSVSAAMEQSTVNLDMIASATEEMGATIKEIAENSSRAGTTTRKAVESATRSLTSISELGSAARAIGTVTETITEISEQTNLLALNATIEAARAGEAGKGFAVVANEIKELARQTASATGKIKEAIEGIQEKTVVTIKDIEDITAVIGEVDQIVNGIVTAVEEQSITTNEIASNVTQASQGVNEINEKVANSSQMTSSMSEEVSIVKDKSEEVKVNSETVNNSADELSKLATLLTELVSKFKVWKFWVHTLTKFSPGVYPPAFLLIIFHLFPKIKYLKIYLTKYIFKIILPCITR